MESNQKMNNEKPILLVEANSFFPYITATNKEDHQMMINIFETMTNTHPPMSGVGIGRGLEQCKEMLEMLFEIIYIEGYSIGHLNWRDYVKTKYGYDAYYE